MAPAQQNSVLFVCLGNYCRSPMAEAIFKHSLKERNIEEEWRVSSCGILGWNAGGGIDDRASHVLAKKGIEFNHIARQLDSSDFQIFYWIFGMDHQNVADVKKEKPQGFEGKIELLGKYDPQNELIIRDPYYDRGDEGFYSCYEQCRRSINGFLDSYSKGS